MTEERIPAKAEQHLLNKIRSSRETQQASGSHPGCTSHSSRGLLKIWSLVLTLRDSHSVGVVWNPSLGMMLKPSRVALKAEWGGEPSVQAPSGSRGQRKTLELELYSGCSPGPLCEDLSGFVHSAATGKEETFSSTPLGSVTGPCKLDDKNGHWHRRGLWLCVHTEAFMETWRPKEADRPGNLHTF